MNGKAAGWTVGKSEDLCLRPLSGDPPTSVGGYGLRVGSRYREVAEPESEYGPCPGT
jgi:hypothetical protein